jgi:hypothetical protein
MSDSASSSYDSVDGILFVNRPLVVWPLAIVVLGMLD